MKLLIDENLSPKLTRLLNFRYAGSIHVNDAELQSRPDELIWSYAHQYGYIILTKDDDFLKLVQRIGSGAPGPKVIQLLIGNCSTPDIVSFLELNSHRMDEFESSLNRVLRLYSPR